MAGSWSLRQLFARDVRVQVLKVEGAGSTEMVEIGDFTIDTAERTASLLGEDLGLTSEEFDVLMFLTTHPQRCVTPHTILATSWTEDRLHQTEFLKALLSLRKKLDGLATRKQYLRTEPLVVYRFDPRSSPGT
jgi:DNA-binding response OmpR family regulator